MQKEARSFCHTKWPDFVATVETYDEDIRYFLSVIDNFEPETDEYSEAIMREAAQLRLNSSSNSKVRGQK